MSDLFLYVQHLLGIGHLRRSAILANACIARGLSVTLASGGPAIPNLGLDPRVTLLQLPPLTVAPGDFLRLLQADGREADAAYRQARLDQLLEGFRAAQPKLLLTELFPFGRRQLRHEILPVLETARARPEALRVVCSLRDILQQRKSERRAESLDWALRYYDRVLVHGDAELVGLERSFPEVAELAERLRYTGYIVQGEPARGASERRSGVIVSCGGGAVGRHLLESALAVCRRFGGGAGDWLFLVGERVGTERLAALRRELPDWAKVEANRPDFLDLLAGASLSISQAGYNSVVDLLSAGTRAVLVPYAEGGETEQQTRAEVLCRYDGFEMVEEAALGPASLEAALRRALDGQGKPPRPAIDLEGARQSADILWQECNALERHDTPSP